MKTADSTPLLANRVVVAGIGLGIGVAAVVAMWFSLPDDYAHALLDRPTPQMIEQGIEATPFTIQNLMWVIFFIALGELLVRYAAGAAELAQLRHRYLPEDERTMLRAADLGELYRRVNTAPGAQSRFLPRLIMRVVLQFQSSRSVGQASTLLNSSLDMYLHEIDLRYSMLRYVMWLIPTLGFIGTVVGISSALGYAGSVTDYTDPSLLPNLTNRLAVAFFTTLLALLLSAILVFFMHIIQAREERSLNSAGQYCLDNLINRLYEK